MLHFFSAFLICILTLWLLLRTCLRSIAIDAPNRRSLHTKLTPRTGGLAIMLSVMITWTSLHVNWYWLLLPLTLILVSLVDDIQHLPIKWRLLAQISVSLMFVLMVIKILPWWLVAPTVLLMTWVTNLYNFMDGSDGLAGGMGFFGFASYAFLAYLAGDIQLATMCGCISASCLAFLIYNFYPAQIFMGDSGSIPLGFLVSSVGLYGMVRGYWPVWLPALIFAPFILDATVTLIQRFIRGETLSQAHRSHYYQRLILLGWGHKNTAIAEYVLMLLLAGSAFLVMKIPIMWQLLSLSVWAMIFFILMALIDKKWNKQARQSIF